MIARLKSERVRGMMESVAAGAEELNASVREISEAMVKSKDTAMSAVSKVETADGQAQRLSIAAQAMSGIVELIGNITGQINLLALNATIESARAGEAGRGFAVVASEVKNLANQAKQATDKITSEIESLNGISGDVVGRAQRHQTGNSERQRICHRYRSSGRGTKHSHRRDVVEHAARRGGSGQHRPIIPFAGVATKRPSLTLGFGLGHAMPVLSLFLRTATWPNAPTPDIGLRPGGKQRHRRESGGQLLQRLRKPRQPPAWPCEG